MAVVGEYRRVDGYGSGNELDGYNQIQAKNDAKIKRNNRGFETGILDMSFLGDTDTRVENVAESFQLTATNTQNITLGRGIATCYGFDLVVDDLKLLDTFSAPATSEKYVFIFLEWDLSDPDSNEFNIGMWDNGTGSSWTPSSQDNLALVPNGKYMMPLYRLTISTNGNVTNIVGYATLGIQTYKGVRNSNYSETSNKYDQKTESDEGTISNKFKQLDDKNDLHDANWKALEHIYLSLTLWNSVDSTSLVKNGKKVILNHSATVNYKGSIGYTTSSYGTISNSSFRPKKDIIAYLYILEENGSYTRIYPVKITTSGVIYGLGVAVVSSGTPATIATYTYNVYLSATYEVN